jgi:hypothetical protein
MNFASFGIQLFCFISILILWKGGKVVVMDYALEIRNLKEEVQFLKFQLADLQKISMGINYSLATQS